MGWVNESLFLPWFLWPTQLLIHGQWWSIFLTQCPPVNRFRGKITFVTLPFVIWVILRVALFQHSSMHPRWQLRVHTALSFDTKVRKRIPKESGKLTKGEAYSFTFFYFLEGCIWLWNIKTPANLASAENYGKQLWHTRSSESELSIFPVCHRLIC